MKSTAPTIGTSRKAVISAPPTTGLTLEEIWEGRAPTAATVERRRSSATPMM